MVAPLGKSDHAVILLELQIQLPEGKQLPSFSWFYRKTRRSELVEAATMVNWQHISSLESVTDMWLTLRDWILDLRNTDLDLYPGSAPVDSCPMAPRKQARTSHG